MREGRLIHEAPAAEIDEDTVLNLVMGGSLLEGRARMIAETAPASRESGGSTTTRYATWVWSECWSSGGHRDRHQAGAVLRPDLGAQQRLTILQQASAIGVVTVGMTFVIIGGGIDLSVGAIIALAGVWATTLATQSHGAIGMIFTALVVGIAVGLINGVLISYGRLVPFIATLAMLVSARGLAAQISGKQTQVSANDTINSIATTKLLGVPLLVWILGVVVAAGWVLLNRTTFGRRTVAVGGNPEAARLAGINVKRHTVLLYALSGLCCGIAAIMLTSQATSAQAAMANLYELDAIAAAIIGGTLLSGGRGTIIGALFGVLVFSTITNLFAINNLSTEVQNMVKGGIIVAAVLIQQFRYRSLTQLLKR
jgi:ribose transport system permease protein